MRLTLTVLTLSLATLGSTGAARAQEGRSLAPPPRYAPAPQPQPYPYPQAQPYTYPQPQPYFAPQRRARRVVGYRTEERAVRGLWVPGVVTFCAGYLLNLIATPVANGLSTDRPESVEEDAWAWSVLPIAGPIVQLVIEAPHPAIPIGSGLLQIGGLALFIAGLTSREQVRLPIREGDPEDPSLSVSAAPLPGGGLVSLTLTHL